MAQAPTLQEAFNRNLRLREQMLREQYQQLGQTQWIPNGLQQAGAIFQDPNTQWTYIQQIAAHCIPQPQQSPRASIKARWLLLRHLTKLQRRQWRARKIFRVVGSQSGDIYEIGEQGVKRLRDGHAFCLLVVDEVGHIPTDDIMLAKKLLIEQDEPKFLATANDLTQRAQTPPPMPLQMQQLERWREEMERRAQAGVAPSPMPLQLQLNEERRLREINEAYEAQRYETIMQRARRVLTRMTR